MKILVTGTAGFIGYHLTSSLLKLGHNVLGIDNINDYYDIELKWGRLAESGVDKNSVLYGKKIQSQKHANYEFIWLDITNKALFTEQFAAFLPDIVVNLAAQAGVRYSLINPDAYIKSNIEGFLNILECARNYPVKHLVFASSSSVYGLNGNPIFSTNDNVDHPISLYAATKKSNEVMAHTYSHLFGIPATGLRFFTVYGPWGRPDMALYIFTKAVYDKKPIEVYNMGEMYRDFTYIDDIVDGIIRVSFAPPKPNPFWDATLPQPSTSSAPYKIFNIGNSKPIKLMDFINAIEEATGIEVEKLYREIQPGDVVATYADISDINELGYKPATSVKEGVKNFVDWYKSYYGV